MNLTEEENNITELLANKVVRRIHRHRESEVVIEFTDGSCFIIDQNENSLEFSITGPKNID